MQDKVDIEYVIESKNHFSLRWKELWNYRELFYFFTWRDVKIKYKQTVLGVLWVVLQPLFLILIFTFFFGQMLGVNAEGLPYPVFAFSGLMLWNFFSASVSNAGNSMVMNASIIKKIYFPRLIIPLSSMLAAVVDLIVTLVIFVVFLFVYPTPISYSIVVYWPLAILLSVIGAAGLGCWISALMVKYRDFRFVVPFVLQVGFFLTPVVYPVSRVTIPYIKYLLALNPMYGAIALFRQPMINGVAEVELISISVASALVAIVFGFMYFRKTELYFADLA